ncbi:MAG: metallophosphoesterase family protein [Actinomycetota bacterium]|nr:metallophosphoesterase family protein [Actinomycetota bacterium]
MRIGVVADTHVGEVLPDLPPEVPQALAGCDLILHAGDITCMSVLDRLGEIAPVVAVQGDHDRLAGIDLPRERVVVVRGRRIGLVHGRRTRAIEMPAAAMSLARGRAVLLGLHRHMRRRLGPVDLIVHGHLHMPVDTQVGGTRVFSPGAVYIPEERDASERTGIKGRAYLRFREGMTPEERASSVGIIEVGPDGMRTQRVLLRDVRARR